MTTSIPPSNYAVPRSSFLPYPELVEMGRRGSPWKIEDSNDHDWLPTNGITDKKARRIFVPLEAAGRGVSIHEMAHVHWSPEKFPRVRFPLILLQAVEDARINLGLVRIGLPVTLDREQLAYVSHLAARDAKSGDIASTIVRAIASLGTDAAEALEEEIDALSPRASALASHWVAQVELRLEKARSRVGGPVAPFRVARQIAKDLAKDLDRHGLLRKDLRVAGVGCCQIVADPDGEGSGLMVREGRKSSYERFLKRLRTAGRGGGGGVAVGRMKIARPPLTVRQPSVLRAGLSRRRCAVEGTQISRPDRYALDRAIFYRTGRGGGGTVLVDQSGSMSLKVEEVEKIVRTAGGAAVVAVYSGRGDTGELRIVAKGASRATNEHFKPFGSGNVVDLPALQWLSKQPEPRLWVSDGCVTGVSDEGCEVILENCHDLAKRARIERVDHAEAAIEALGGVKTKS
jgi:hypothetical protein